MARSDIGALIVLKERTRPPEALEKRGEQLCQKREFVFYWVVLVGQKAVRKKEQQAKGTVGASKIVQGVGRLGC